MILLKDHVKGRGTGEKSQKGLERLTRAHRVTDIDAVGYDLIAQALLVDDLEEIGSEHPSVNGMFLNSIVPTIVANEVNAVDLSLQYELKPDPERPNDLAQIEVGASVTQADTNKDWEGTLLTASYTPTGSSTAIEEKPTVSKLFPQVTISYSRLETGFPGDTAKTYVGKVNTGGWSIDPASTARQWLCTGIVGRSSDGGLTWSVNYTFEFNEGDWDTEWLYFDSDGKKPNDVKDTDPINGYLKAQIYEEIDFNGLNLT